LKNKPIVYVNFPKTGLGNLLLLWARALVFSKTNNLPLIVSPWWGFRWGAIIRQETKKRIYWKYFKETGGLRFLKLKILKLFWDTREEPENYNLDKGLLTINTIYEFKKIITNYDLFGKLREHEEMIKKELLSMLHPSQIKRLVHQNKPTIGVHIRRGDFKLGSTLTELDFFIESIQIIRSIVQRDLPVTVFTDAKIDEIKDILSLSNVKLADENSDIIDILLLSQSDILILSAGSTFSYWGAFLSNAFVIKSSLDWLKLIKPENKKAGYKEVEWDMSDENSTKNLKINFGEYFNSNFQNFI
jgi:hypothetical protein